MVSYVQTICAKILSFPEMYFCAMNNVRRQQGRHAVHQPAVLLGACSLAGLASVLLLCECCCVAHT